jgi:hypothetical protein
VFGQDGIRHGCVRTYRAFGPQFPILPRAVKNGTTRILPARPAFCRHDLHSAGTARILPARPAFQRPARALTAQIGFTFPLPAGRPEFNGRIALKSPLVWVRIRLAGKSAAAPPLKPFYVLPTATKC